MKRAVLSGYLASTLFGSCVGSSPDRKKVDCQDAECAREPVSEDSYPCVAEGSCQIIESENCILAADTEELELVATKLHSESINDTNAKLLATALYSLYHCHKQQTESE